jgi:hypothetical protein
LIKSISPFQSSYQSSYYFQWLYLESCFSLKLNNIVGSESSMLNKGELGSFTEGEAGKGITNLLLKVGDAVKSKYLPFKYIEKASQTLDNRQRAALYNYFTKNQGLSDIEAIKKLADVKLDYGNLSKFEKEYMRQIAPFYSFARRSIPQFAKSQLPLSLRGIKNLSKQQKALSFAERFGTATTGVKGERDSNVQEGMGIRLPMTSESGKPLYLRGGSFMPAGVISELLNAGDKGIRQGKPIEAVSSYIANQFNPSIKGSMELSTGGSPISSQGFQNKVSANEPARSVLPRAIGMSKLSESATTTLIPMFSAINTYADDTYALKKSINKTKTPRTSINEPDTKGWKRALLKLTTGASASAGNLSNEKNNNLMDTYRESNDIIMKLGNAAGKYSQSKSYMDKLAYDYQLKRFEEFKKKLQQKK